MFKRIPNLIKRMLYFLATCFLHVASIYLMHSLVNGLQSQDFVNLVSKVALRLEASESSTAIFVKNTVKPFLFSAQHFAAPYGISLANKLAVLRLEAPESTIVTFVNTMKHSLALLQRCVMPHGISLANRLVGSCLSFLRPILPLGSLEPIRKGTSVKIIVKVMLGYNLDRDEALGYLSLFLDALWPTLLMKECYPKTLGAVYPNEPYTSIRVVLGGLKLAFGEKPTEAHLNALLQSIPPSVSAVIRKEVCPIITITASTASSLVTWAVAKMASIALGYLTARALRRLMSGIISRIVRTERLTVPQPDNETQRVEAQDDEEKFVDLGSEDNSLGSETDLSGVEESPSQVQQLNAQRDGEENTTTTEASMVVRQPNSDETTTSTPTPPSQPTIEPVSAFTAPAHTPTPEHAMSGPEPLPAPERATRAAPEPLSSERATTVPSVTEPVVLATSTTEPAVLAPEAASATGSAPSAPELTAATGPAAPAPEPESLPSEPTSASSEPTSASSEPTSASAPEPASAPPEPASPAPKPASAPSEPTSAPPPEPTSAPPPEPASAPSEPASAPPPEPTSAPPEPAPEPASAPSEPASVPPPEPTSTPPEPASPALEPASAPPGPAPQPASPAPEPAPEPALASEPTATALEQVPPPQAASTPKPVSPPQPTLESKPPPALAFTPTPTSEPSSAPAGPPTPATPGSLPLVQNSLQVDLETHHSYSRPIIGNQATSRPSPTHADTPTHQVQATLAAPSPSFDGEKSTESPEAPQDHNGSANTMLTVVVTPSESPSLDEGITSPETSPQEHGSMDTAVPTEHSVASTSSGLKARVEEEENWRSPIIQKLRSRFSQQVLAYRFEILDESGKPSTRTLVEDVKLRGEQSVAFNPKMPRDRRRIVAFLHKQYMLNLKESMAGLHKKLR